MQLQEPIATLTNVAYLAAAVALTVQDGSSALIAALTLLTIGSGAFHFFGSTKGTPAHRADEGVLYAVAGVLVYLAWASNLWVLIAAMLVVGVLILILDKVNVVLPVGVAALFILVGLVTNGGWQAALMPLALAVPAFLARFLSDRFLTDLLHGLWHVLIAATIYSVWAASTP